MSHERCECHDCTQARLHPWERQMATWRMPPPYDETKENPEGYGKYPPYKTADRLARIARDLKEEYIKMGRVGQLDIADFRDAFLKEL
jgi:hypothetical protein